MRLLDRLFGGYNGGAPLAVSAQSTGLLTSYASGGVEKITPEFQAYCEQAYASNGIVFAVQLARSSLFSEARFKFRALSDKHLFGSPALSLLERPWPGGTTGELLSRMDQHASLAGQSFTRNAGDRLEQLRPDRVARILGELDDGSYEIAGYGYDREGVGDYLTEVYPASEVADWTPIPDPLSQFRGMSWLTPVVREIESDIAMTTHKSKFFDNAATPNLLVKLPFELKSDQLDRYRDRLDARSAGVQNAWKSMVLDRGADATVIGQNFEEMAFTAVQAAGENRIAAAAGVPGIVVGLKEGLEAATYSNYVQAMRRFVDITMRQNWRSVCAALAKLVEVPAGAELWFDTTDIAALREGEQERATTAQTLANAAGELIRVGYDPSTVGPALTAGDFTLLVHTGAIPTALYPDGKAPEPARAEPLVVNMTVPEREVHITTPEVNVLHSPTIDARTTVDPGAFVANVDARSEFSVPEREVTVRFDQPEPVLTRKRIETDDKGRIVGVIEERA